MHFIIAKNYEGNSYFLNPQNVVTGKSITNLFNIEL